MFSDATNVMKGVRSGVQKLIKDECPSVLDVSCISYLADLTIKAGMKSLPVNIDQLFFIRVVRGSKNFVTFGILFLHPSLSLPTTLAQSSSLCQSLYYSI